MQTSVSALVADEITGVELVTNGDFSNGQTGWSFQTGWAVSNGGATVSTAGVTSRVVTNTFLRSQHIYYD